MSDPKRPSAPEGEIINIYFVGLIHVGGVTIEGWSGRSGETNETYKRIKVEDRGAQGVLLRFDGGPNMQHEIDVPRSKISQITRAVKR